MANSQYANPPYKYYLNGALFWTEKKSMTREELVALHSLPYNSVIRIANPGPPIIMQPTTLVCFEYMVVHLEVAPALNHVYFDPVTKQMVCPGDDGAVKTYVPFPQPAYKKAKKPADHKVSFMSRVHKFLHGITASDLSLARKVFSKLLDDAGEEWEDKASQDAAAEAYAHIMVAEKEQAFRLSMHDTWLIVIKGLHLGKDTYTIDTNWPVFLSYDEAAKYLEDNLPYSGDRLVMNVADLIFAATTLSLTEDLHQYSPDSQNDGVQSIAAPSAQIAGDTSSLQEEAEDAAKTISETEKAALKKYFLKGLMAFQKNKSPTINNPKVDGGVTEPKVVSVHTVTVQDPKTGKMMQVLVQSAKSIPPE